MNPDTSFDKHPITLWWLSFIFATFMCGFGGLIAAVVLFFHQGLHTPLKQSYTIFSVFLSLMWTLPVLGGYLSGKFGARQASAVGLFFCLAGIILVACNQMKLSLLGLGVFAIGNGLSTPALCCLVDHIYQKEDPRKESGFTLFYLFFNLGAVIAILLGGYTAKHFGYQVSFGIDAILVGIGFVTYLIKIPQLKFSLNRNLSPLVPLSNHSIILILAVICLIVTPISYFLFKHSADNNFLLYLLGAWMIVLLIVIAEKQQEHLARKRTYGFLFLTLISVSFWAIYALEPSLLSIFIQNNVVKHLFGIHVPASSFFAFEGIFIILLGMLISRLWLYLNNRNKNPALSYKFAFSLIISGFAFIYLIVCIWINGFDKPLPMILMIFSYAFFAAAELLVGPLGYAMAGRLSPDGQEALFMGIGQLFQGLAAIFGGFLAQLAITPVNGTYSETNPIYTRLFLGVGVSVILLGLVVYRLAPRIKKLL